MIFCSMTRMLVPLADMLMLNVEFLKCIKKTQNYSVLVNGQRIENSVLPLFLAIFGLVFFCLLCFDEQLILDVVSINF